MDNFANIGKAVLIQALGLQKNYTEIIESTVNTIDYSNSACSNCKYKEIISVFKTDSDIYNLAIQSCNNCSQKQFTTKNIYKKVYHNEKNRYGYKPLLKGNALKLLILLHFSHPDKFGIIQNVDLREFAEYLSCNIRTINNNLKILQKYNYISFCKTSTYTINLCLSDYDTYYLPAQKGGRGFIVMSKELLSELISINSLLSLRIHIRELIEFDNLNAKGPFTAVSKKYSEIKRILPDYCKPSIIKKAIANDTNIFDISLNDTSIRFEIKDKYNCKIQKENCFNLYVKNFNDFICEFNNSVSSININEPYNIKFKNFFDLNSSVQPDEFNMINFKDFEIEDLAQLSIQYSFDLIINALCTIYKSYILNKRKITNLGGLVRTVVQAQFDILLNAA